MALRGLIGKTAVSKQFAQAALRALGSHSVNFSSSRHLHQNEAPVFASPEQQTFLSSRSDTTPSTSSPASNYADSLRTQARFPYRLRVVTGNLRGAGTESKVTVKLVGTNGESAEFEITDDKAFERGSVETVVLPVDIDLGNLKMVLVKRAEAGVSETGAGWFLDKVLVDGPKGESWSFPCMQWFGISDCGDITGPLERHLVQATFISVDRVVEPQAVNIQASAATIPHPDKVKKGARGINKDRRGRGGEDAYFYSYGRNGIFGMGVADGVGAWMEKGINSGIFSNKLMDTSYNMVKRGYDDVVQVLKTASRYVETEGLFGSSTYCLMTINMNQGLLSSANLGDSGFMVVGSRVFRPEVHVIFRTPQQEHQFGFPYQLGHHKNAASPKDAMLESFQVFPGDTIVMGSDGLFDNVFVSEIVSQIKAHRESGKGPQSLVHELVKQAHEASMDRRSDTPYSRGYSDAYDLAMSGGKPDDITVGVAYLN